MALDSISEQPLKVEDPSDLLLVLLYAPGRTGRLGEPIDGITRLQKLMFLLQNEKSLPRLLTDAKQYMYSPYKMGPYSADLRKALLAGR